MNQLIRCPKFNIFKYVSLLKSNLRLILLSLFIGYFFPIIDKSNINILNLLGFFFITSGVGFFKSNSNNMDLLKILFFSFKKSILSILSLNYIKTRLIYLILIIKLLI